MYSPTKSEPLGCPACHFVSLWPSEETMHRWSPHCALGWLQAELEEAEQEAEVRGELAGARD